MRLHPVIMILAWLLGAPVLTACTAGSGKANDTAGAPQALSASTTAEYKIEPGDSLSIRFVYTPELDVVQMVRADGRISLTYLPEQIVAGKTVGAVKRQLNQAYVDGKVLVDPVVTVSVQQTAAGRVFVGGEVGKPGQVPLGGYQTLSQTLIKAGGVKTTGNGHRVMVIRHLDGNRMVSAAIDVDAIYRGGAGDVDPPLKPYDIVYVPTTAITDVDRAVLQYVQSIVPTFFGFGYSVNNGGGAGNQNITVNNLAGGLP